jgi:hypothetical protein
MIKALKGTQIHFCKTRKGCCPTVTPNEDGSFLIGGDEEGYSKFTMINMKDFVEAAKSGAFDNLIS